MYSSCFRDGIHLISLKSQENIKTNNVYYRSSAEIFEKFLFKIQKIRPRNQDLLRNIYDYQDPLQPMRLMKYTKHLMSMRLNTIVEEVLNQIVNFGWD